LRRGTHQCPDLVTPINNAWLSGLRRLLRDPQYLRQQRNDLSPPERSLSVKERFIESTACRSITIGTGTPFVPYKNNR